MALWQPGILAPGTVPGQLLVQHQQAFLCHAGGPLFSPGQLAQLALPVTAVQGLGHYAEQPVQLQVLSCPVEVPGCHWTGLRQWLAGEAPAGLLALLRFAAQIGTWAVRHRFCGCCGAPLQPLPGERAMHCAACQLSQYPQLSPCMIALVTRGDEILLARSARHARGVFSALAGFVEPGETVEGCVHREVQEEVGLQVEQLQYVASQNWPFPHALMLGFLARYRAGQVVPQPGEIEEARWFAVDALPALPGPHSLARYLIDRYVASRLGLPPPGLPD